MDIPTQTTLGRLLPVLAALLPLGTIAWALDVPRRLGLTIYPESFGAIMLGLALLLVYLHVPLRRGASRDRVPWLDGLAGLTGLAACLFLAWKFPQLSTSAIKTPAGLATGAILVPLFLEGARRTAGLPIALVALGFLVLGLTAHLLPPPVQGCNVSLESLGWYLAWNNSAIADTPTMVVVTVVVAFVVFGQALFVSGGSAFFTEISMALMGRFRGGQAKIAIIASALISGFAFGYRGTRLNLRHLGGILSRTGFGVLDIFMIAPLAGIVIGVLNVTGLSFTLALGLVVLAGGSVLGLLALTAGVSIVLGMGMPTVGVYILLATLVAPALVKVGIDPLAAHLFIFYFGMLSMITPPVALGAFAAASISGARAMQTGFAAMRFGWSAFVIPFLFVLSPSLLLGAPVSHVLLDSATALASVWMIAAGFIGHALRPIGGVRRAAYGLAGAALILPVGMAGFIQIANLAGAALALVLLGSDALAARKTPTPDRSPS